VTKRKRQEYFLVVGRKRKEERRENIRNSIFEQRTPRGSKLNGDNERHSFVTHISQSDICD
jgi:hypothetical protein